MTSFEACLQEAGEQWASTGEAIARVLGAMVAELDGGSGGSARSVAEEVARLGKLEESFSTMLVQFSALADARVPTLEDRLTQVVTVMDGTLLPLMRDLAATVDMTQSVVDESVSASVSSMARRLDAIEERLDQPDWKERR